MIVSTGGTQSLKNRKFEDQNVQREGKNPDDFVPFLITYISNYWAKLLMWLHQTCFMFEDSNAHT